MSKKNKQGNIIINVTPPANTNPKKNSNETIIVAIIGGVFAVIVALIPFFHDYFTPKVNQKDSSETYEELLSDTMETWEKTDNGYWIWTKKDGNQHSIPIVVKDEVAGHDEYRYWRWTDDINYVNWCKEYGESISGTTYREQFTEWSPLRAGDRQTGWQCGHSNSEHPSHVHWSGIMDDSGNPYWIRYKVNGYDIPDFYWEEVRWVAN